MTAKSEPAELLRRLEESYAGLRGTRLEYQSPFQLLIATVLSAQCTDEKVNEVTLKLFERFRTPEDFARADLDELEAIVRPTGFYRVKARRIKEISSALVEMHGSAVPASMDQLLQLKGIARKSANIILTNAFGIVEGIAVDTHVMRLARRLGLTEAKTRERIEEDLMKVFSTGSWGIINSLLVEHGRRVCQARRPRCRQCSVFSLCLSGPLFIQAT